MSKRVLWKAARIHWEGEKLIKNKLWTGEKGTNGVGKRGKEENQKIERNCWNKNALRLKENEGRRRMSPCSESTESAGIDVDGTYESPRCTIGRLKNIHKNHAP